MSILNNIEVNKGKGKRVHIAIISLLIIGIPMQVIPYIWMFSNSFKNVQEIIRIPPTLLPLEPTLKGLIQTFQRFHLWENIINTAILCIGTILIQITISALAAFSLSKLRPRFGNVILLFFVGTMMISTQALMFPLYIMMVHFPIGNISLINNFWSYILASSAWGFTLFLFKGFFDGIPNELMESAKIDGANSLRIFLKIILPLSKPVIAVNSLLTFMAVYNDFMLPVFLLPNESKWTIMVRIFVAQDGSSANPNNIFVMLTVATIPVIIVYLMAQKKVVQGISMSGLKG